MSLRLPGLRGNQLAVSRYPFGGPLTRAPADIWNLPPPLLRLGPDEVHVWRVELGIPEPRFGDLEDSLSDDERNRAESFHFASDRRRYVASRGILRALLARYLDEQPARLRFRYGPHDKPYLATHEASGLRFNASHSAELSLVALSRGREVGIDLELMRADIDLDAMAEQVFSPLENAAFRSVPKDHPGARQETFYGLWTCKEACIKAMGRGFSVAPSVFDIAIGPEGPALLSLNGDSREDNWEVRQLAPGSKFAAALAVEGHGWELKLWRWVEGSG